MPTHKQNMSAWAKRRKQIVKMSETMSHREIAEEMGMTPARVGQIIQKETGPKRKRK